MLYCLNNPSKFRKNFGLTNSEQLNCSVDVHTERPEKLALWASVRRIFTIHNGYPHLPIHV